MRSAGSRSSSSPTTSASAGAPTASSACSTARSSKNNYWRSGMYARVTLLEIDTLRATVGEALETFRAQTLERLREQLGYRGVWVLATSEGKALLMSLWETEAQASIEGDHQFY